MKIWQVNVDTAYIQQRGMGSMSEFLGIIFTEIGDNYMKASMPVDARTRQPLGIMHGGASCVLAETLGSTAANCCVDPKLYYCVGLDINTNHIRAMREGLVYATARPYHLGKTTQVWSIEIKNAEEKLVSVTRLTMAVLAKKN
jgi:uncharacterized protein (TIGR00369 family)